MRARTLWLESKAQTNNQSNLTFVCCSEGIQINVIDHKKLQFLISLYNRLPYTRFVLFNKQCSNLPTADAVVRPKVPLEDPVGEAVRRGLRVAVRRR